MILRATPPRIHLGPDDHGREISLDDFERASGEEGYHYELIDGRVYVSPLPDEPHRSIEQWLFIALLKYCDRHPEVINEVSNKSRVFVPGRRRATCPEPDIAAYEDYPHHLPRRQRRWRDLHPILVVEIISPDTVEKDYVRNVGLYLEAPSIREYWIVDQRPDPDYPLLTVYRRRGQRWQKPIAVAPGQTYTTRLLPGFELKLDAPEEE